MAKISYAKECVVCGNAVELSECEENALLHGLHIDAKICFECKRAILWAKEQSVKESAE